MITAITKSNTPAPTAPITASMFWPVFSDSNSTKCKLLYIEKNGISVETKKKADLFVLSKITRQARFFRLESTVRSSIFVGGQYLLLSLNY